MDPNYEQQYLKTEEKHPWFIYRRKLVYNLIKTIPKNARILDYGSGSGIFLKLLKQKGFINVIGYEPSRKMREKYKDIKIVKNKNKISGKYDIILLLDVIEHIKNDELFISGISKLLNQKGNLIITVPASNILWSSHDVLNKHYRRYNKKSLKKAFKKSELQILRLSYWNFFFFLPIAFIKILKRKSKSQNSDINFMPWPASQIYKKLLKLENFLIMKGIDFPIGINLFCVLEKRTKLK